MEEISGNKGIDIPILYKRLSEERKYHPVSLNRLQKEYEELEENIDRTPYSKQIEKITNLVQNAPFSLFCAEENIP